MMLSMMAVHHHGPDSYLIDIYEFHYHVNSYDSQGIHVHFLQLQWSWMNVFQVPVQFVLINLLLVGDCSSE